jgi:hypothetical protein
MSPAMTPVGKPSSPISAAHRYSTTRGIGRRMLSPALGSRARDGDGVNSTRSLLRSAYRVAIKEHVVDRWTVPAATFKLCAPDETAARRMATRAAHRSAQGSARDPPRGSFSHGGSSRVLW